MQYRQLQVISGKGTGSDRFTEALRGIGIDRAGLIYAVGDREVKVFESTGKLQRRWQTAKPGYCIAIDGKANVYVGEVGQIEKFDGAGKLLTIWQDADWFGLVSAIGFYGEYILVADTKDRCIRRYDQDGKWLNDIGKDNNTRGFLIPNGHLDFSVDTKGIIHAANPAKFRVERYTMEGKLIGRFGRFGGRRPEDFPGCCNPTNLALGNHGQVAVTEKAGPRMKVYDADGKLLWLVGSEAFDPNCKNMDIAVDSRGRIYVADTVRLHICVFAPKGVDSQPSTAPASSPLKRSRRT
ncbi:MAG: NHL repeat-containing protein [Planctomycetota bacterium]|jgi:sugar lactone lactonase YvrE